MAKNIPKAHGHIKCFECGTICDINQQTNDRFYYNCKSNRDCLAHHRFSPGISDVRDVPGYIPLRDAAPIRNVTEPVQEPAPVVKPKQEEGVYGYDW